MHSSSAPAVGNRSARPVSAATALAAAALAVGLTLSGPGVLATHAQSDSEPLRTVSVSAVGSSEIEPDQAVIHLGVTARGETAQRASRKAAAAMDAVIASLGDSGVDEADIKTTRLELRQVRQRDRDTDEVTVRWQVRNRVKATIRDIDSAGDTVDAAISAGATNLDRLQFGASDPSAALAEARADAVATAAAAAAQLASAAGVEISGVLSITEGSVPGPYPLLDSRLYREEGGVRAAATPIQPGMIDITVTVYIDYLVS